MSKEKLQLYLLFKTIRNAIKLNEVILTKFRLWTEDYQYIDFAVLTKKLTQMQKDFLADTIQVLPSPHHCFYNELELTLSTIESEYYQDIDISSMADYLLSEYTIKDYAKEINNKIIPPIIRFLEATHPYASKTIYQTEMDECLSSLNELFTVLYGDEHVQITKETILARIVEE